MRDEAGRVGCDLDPMVFCRFTRTNVIKIKSNQMNATQSNYLKYYKVVHRYFYKKYDLQPTELDMLLFLYSEEYFKRSKFKEYEQLMPWDRKRFDDLLSKGWFDIFRTKVGAKSAMYILSHKARKMIGKLYKVLEGENVSLNPIDNPFFQKKVGYTDRKYKEMIIAMTKDYRKTEGRSKKRPISKGESLADALKDKTPE